VKEYIDGEYFNSIGEMKTTISSLHSYCPVHLFSARWAFAITSLKT
jgi:hypothetical protein